MSFGTATFILAILYLAVVSHGFRMVFLGLVAIAGGGRLALMSYGAD